MSRKRKFRHVHYKFGKGTILRVDRTTFSIPMATFYSFDLDTTVFRPLSEIRTITDDPDSKIKEYIR